MVKYLCELGLYERETPHGLRSVAVIEMVNAGVPVDTVKSYVGSEMVALRTGNSEQVQKSQAYDSWKNVSIGPVLWQGKNLASFPMRYRERKKMNKYVT